MYTVYCILYTVDCRSVRQFLFLPIIWFIDIVFVKFIASQFKRFSKMCYFHYARLLCLVSLLVQAACFVPHLKLNNRFLSVAASSSSIQHNALFTRAAAFLVGSTLPFLLQDQLGLSLSPPTVQADSTGKVRGPALVL